MNRIYGNTIADVGAVKPDLVISARNNYWDHVPPTVGFNASFDVYVLPDATGTTIDTTGAKSLSQ